VPRRAMKISECVRVLALVGLFSGMRFSPFPPQLNASARIYLKRAFRSRRDSRKSKSTITADGSNTNGKNVNGLVRSLWAAEEGQDIAEYAVMLAVILVVVVGTLRLIGSNTNTVFSSVSTLQ